ncbi:hypothetical protein [Mycolicibacterium mucogenicum]|nr:hypothetical protein [Mycolicibacterium mucogenicum]
MGKRSLIDSFSLLVLNKSILKDHVESWTDDDIAERSRRMAAAVCAVWPGPTGNG